MGRNSRKRKKDYVSPEKARKKIKFTVSQRLVNISADEAIKPSKLFSRNFPRSFPLQELSCAGAFHFSRNSTQSLPISPKSVTHCRPERIDSPAKPKVLLSTGNRHFLIIVCLVSQRDNPEKNQNYYTTILHKNFNILELQNHVSGK